MTLQVAYQLLVAAACVAISYGVNRYQRPSFDPVYAPQEYTEAHGTLQLNYHGRPLTFALMTSHVNVYSISRMGREYSLRELSVRAAAPREQQAGLELYIDLSRNIRGVGANGGDPSSFARQELPVARSGRFGAHPSYVLTPDGQVRHVVSGNLRLTEVNPTELRDPPHYHSTGRIELQLDGPSGVELITGRVDGQIVWD